MKVLIKEPEKMAYIKEIENELKPLQEIVGGYIEVITLPRNTALIINEEGKLKGMAPNFPLGWDTIVGPAIFLKTTGEEFTDFDDENLMTICEVLG